MKKTKIIAKFLIAFGVIYSFRRVGESGCFGVYGDNSWEILLLSLILISTGLSMLLFSDRNSNNRIS